MTGVSKVFRVDQLAQSGTAPLKETGVEKMSPRSVAVDFLGVLRNGPIAVGELEALARCAGLIEAQQPIGQSRAFRDARKVLGIRAYQKGRRWLWALAALPLSDEHRLPPSDDLPTTPESSPSEPTQVNTFARTIADSARATAREQSPEAQRRQSDYRLSGRRVAVLKWAEEIARLDRARPPDRSIPRLQWNLFCNDSAKFVTTDVAVRANALGWDDKAIFGFDLKVPTRRDRMGLLWFVLGGQITEIYHDGATISSGIRQRYHARRRIDPQALRLPWR